MNKACLFLVGIVAVALAACESSPDPVEVSDVVSVEATVVAVDTESRSLVVQGADGGQLGFNVGPEVRNLAQVEVGDTLRVSYYTGYVVSMTEPGEAGADMEVAAGVAEEGARPGAAIGDTMRATVEILSVADDGTSVSFRDTEGRLNSINVQNEEVQAFARKLKAGDLVDVRYTEAVAIGVEAPDAAQ